MGIRTKKGLIFVLKLIINSDFLLLILKEKNQHKKRTKSGNIICPGCKVRTKLYKLKDGRRKCKK